VTYRVLFAPAAGKELARIDRPQRLRIQTAIAGLADDPRPRGAVALRTRPGLFRVRIGHYRAVYSVEDDRLLVLVVDVGHRSEVYR
jgi:mRNA interferase RelE/StbE